LAFSARRAASLVSFLQVFQRRLRRAQRALVASKPSRL
jgi:hypothetical protein